MLRVSVVLLSVLCVAYAAQSIGPLQPKPEKFSEVEGCYIKDLDRVIPFGKAAPSLTSCMEYRCSETLITYNAVLAEEWERREELERLQEEQNKMLEEERLKRKQFEVLQAEKEAQYREAEKRLPELEQEKQQLDMELKAAQHKIS